MACCIFLGSHMQHISTGMAQNQQCMHCTHTFRPAVCPATWTVNTRSICKYQGRGRRYRQALSVHPPAWRRLDAAAWPACGPPAWPRCGRIQGLSCCQAAAGGAAVARAAAGLHQPMGACKAHGVKGRRRRRGVISKTIVITKTVTLSTAICTRRGVLNSASGLHVGVHNPCTKTYLALCTCVR